VISYCPTVSSCVYVYIYVLINFWLCYVIKFTWMIQQRWKTFDATVRIGFCPFLTLKNSFQALNWFFDISNGQTPFNQLIQIYEATALWVKSGNRGILKCLKVNNHFELIFHRKMFIYFLGDAKLPKVYDWFLGLIIYVKYLRSYFQKT